MSDSSNTESCPSTANDPRPSCDAVSQTTGVHFLTEKTQEETKMEYNDNREKEQDNTKETTRGKNDSVEYITRTDGSVVCKLCGEILQSRTHWYRHKYKLHVPHSSNPAPLFKCEQCLVYFKSRKGYIGHLASRHSEVLLDSSPVLTNAQVEAMAKEQQLQQQLQQQQIQQLQQEFKEELDPELAIPKSSVPNYQTASHKAIPAKPPEPKKFYRNNKIPVESPSNCPEWKEKRIREEKLVSDIIDRVRRECEAQGSGGSARRGYSRRTTVMHT